MVRLTDDEQKILSDVAVKSFDETNGRDTNVLESVIAGKLLAMVHLLGFTEVFDAVNRCRERHGQSKV